MTKITAVLLALAFVVLSGTAHAATPSSDGSFVVADTRDVVRDATDGTTVYNTWGQCVRTRWMNNQDVCADEVAEAPPMPPRAIRLSREDRTVYFGFNKADLTPEMKQRLDTLAEVLKSEKSVTGAHIVGYADRIGNPSYNEQLSKKRAETVQEYLVEKGIINTQVAKTRWFGSSKPTTNCPSTEKKPALVTCLQNDRRVEVEIMYSPDVQASGY